MPSRVDLQCEETALTAAAAEVSNDVPSLLPLAPTSRLTGATSFVIRQRNISGCTFSFAPPPLESTHAHGKAPAAAGFTVCPAVSAGREATVYQAVTAFEPAAHPDFGAAAPGSYVLDLGMLARTLDPDGRPVYSESAGGTATTAGARLWSQRKPLSVGCWQARPERWSCPKAPKASWRSARLMMSTHNHTSNDRVRARKNSESSGFHVQPSSYLLPPAHDQLASRAGASTFQDWFGSRKDVSWAAGASAWDSARASYAFAERPLTDSTRYQAAVLEVRSFALNTILQHGYCAAQRTLRPCDLE